MKIPLIPALVVAMGLAIGAAQAEGKRDRATSGQAGNFAYCLKMGPGPGDCKYKSLQQCQAAMSGTTGECVANYGR